ncbi:MAG: hypothetical protein PF795_02385 [Kiritimatiellae bacterium]|jgi:hypothetical protein|nr:hypothetical protein [Kiritimatiellia bacterium]
MKIIYLAVAIFIQPIVVFGEYSELLFREYVDIIKDVYEIDESSLKENFSSIENIPLEMREVFRVTEEEEKLLSKGKGLCTAEDFENILKKTYESKTNLPIETAELVNRNKRNGLNEVQRTLVCRLIEYELKRKREKHNE